MSNNQKRVIPYADFDLLKVKYNSKEGIEAVYFDKSTGRKNTVKDSDHQPHPHFFESLKELAPHVVHVLGLQRGWDVAREELRDNSEGLQKAMQGAKEADKSFTVSGIAFSGEGKNASVKITGSLKCLTGAVGMASPLINFQNNALAIEQTVQALCEKVKEETYNFIYCGKVDSKQEEMEFDEASDPDKDQPIKGTSKKPKGKQLDIEKEAEKLES